MATVKVFMDKQMDRRTHGQAKNWTGQKLYAPHLSMWGHKKAKLFKSTLWQPALVV